jgi:hypothetical protein
MLISTLRDVPRTIRSAKKKNIYIYIYKWHECPGSYKIVWPPCKEMEGDEEEGRRGKGRGRRDNGGGRREEEGGERGKGEWEREEG